MVQFTEETWIRIRCNSMRIRNPACWFHSVKKRIRISYIRIFANQDFRINLFCNYFVHLKLKLFTLLNVFLPGSMQTDPFPMTYYEV
jgi:hypothetical protein